MTLLTIKLIEHTISQYKMDRPKRQEFAKLKELADFEFCRKSYWEIMAGNLLVHLP